MHGSVTASRWILILPAWQNVFLWRNSNSFNLQLFLIQIWLEATTKDGCWVSGSHCFCSKQGDTRTHRPIPSWKKSEGDFTWGACCCVRDDCCRCQPWPPDQHHNQAPPKQGFVVTMIIAMTSASHEISRSCTISRNKINFLFVRLSFTFQTWASATLGQLFSSKSFSGASENFLHGANRSLEWTFFRHCPKSRSSVCPDYLNRLHDFLGVDPSNLRMAGVRKLHFIIISIYRWSAFSTSTQWSWIPILWQWSCTCPGEIKIPQLLVA